MYQNHSCLYPNTTRTGRDYDKGLCRNHREFFRDKNESEIIGEIRNIIAFSRKKKIQKIVFSWEGLFDRHQYARIIYKATAGYEDIDPQIIVYLRHQDHWLESAWKQWFANKKNFRDFDHFIDTYKIKWDESLARWSDVFGRDRISVHPYEPVQLDDGLISHFLKLMGINYRENFWNEVENQDLNPGFQEDVIEILRLNRDFYPDGDNSPLQNFLSRHLPDDYKKKPFEKYSLLSPEKRIEILNRYEPMNRSIAQMFLNRADGRLFYEPMPSDDEPWVHPEGMTVEKLVPVFSSILYSMDTKKEKPVTVLIQKKVKAMVDYWFWRLTKRNIFCIFSRK